VGENGAGKSTLIKLLAGVEMPDEGAEYSSDGTPAQIRTPLDAIRLGISVIYQDISLFPISLYAENICVGQDHQDGGGLMRWRKVYRDAQDCLEEFNIHMDCTADAGQHRYRAPADSGNSEGDIFKGEDDNNGRPTASLSTSEIQVLYKIIGELKKKGIYHIIRKP
jgi:ABC-type sugar transport system ATPase subunit